MSEIGYNMFISEQIKKLETPYCIFFGAVTFIRDGSVIYISLIMNEEKAG